MVPGMTARSLQGRLRVSVAVISRRKVRDASSPGDADPRLRLVVVEYLDDSRHRLVEIHVDLHKPAVQSERKNEAQRVRGFHVENSERLHEVPVDEVADETQGNSGGTVTYAYGSSVVPAPPALVHLTRTKAFGWRSEVGTSAS